MVELESAKEVSVPLERCSDINASSMKPNCHPAKYKLVFKTRKMSEYQGQINHNAVPNKGLYILAEYQTDEVPLPVKILIDSGSSMSLMHRGVYHKIPDWAKPPIHSTGKKIKFADGRIQEASGIVTLPLQIGETTTNIDFLLGEYSDEAILGMSDISKLELKIDFSKLLVIHAGKWWLPVHDIQQTLIGRKVEVCGSMTTSDIN